MAESTFRYIRHADAKNAAALGYILTTLSPPHGEYSCLAEWLCACGREPPDFFASPTPESLRGENFRLRGELALAQNAVRLLTGQNKALQERIEILDAQILAGLRDVRDHVKALP